MAKLGCASCGGTKMSTGGSPKKKMAMGGSAGIVGMPKYGNNPRTSTGAMLKNGGMVKAKFGSSVPVQHSPKPGRVRAASGVGTVPIGTRKKKGGPVLPKAQKGMFNVTGQKPFASTGSKVGLGTGIAGIVGVAGKALADKIKGKREEKKLKKQALEASDTAKPTAKKGGATKAAKFAALAPPYNKATAADRIVGAKKNARKKK